MRRAIVRSILNTRVLGTNFPHACIGADGPNCHRPMNSSILSSSLMHLFLASIRASRLAAMRDGRWGSLIFGSAAFRLIVLGCVLSASLVRTGMAQNRPPNILLAISDDQSFPHASAYGSEMVRTPVFDRIAREGVLFTNSYVASPGCSPSRAALLTGRYPWQVEHAGTHASAFPKKYVVFPDLLEDAGYFVGYTGKGWGPGDWEVSGRERNPAGNVYNDRTLEPPRDGIRATDYAANFADFLAERPEGRPFYFWFGASEPHRDFERGAGLAAGKQLSDAEVPAFLPDVDVVRSDLLDYATEIEWFDEHLGRMIAMLERAGELANTLVIVTSDNGMAFPRAKANAYDYGIHVPLAVRWGDEIGAGRIAGDVVSLVDLAPTILEAAGVPHPGVHPMSGRSLVPFLTSDGTGAAVPGRDAVYAARERHSSSRFENRSYPQRALRSGRYLYVRNFEPDRWPSGAPRKYEEDGSLGPMHGAYHDIDAAPSLSYMVDHRDVPQVHTYLHLAVALRPAEELFDVETDPACLHNLAADPAHAEAASRLRAMLNDYLEETGDPRALGGGEIFESYERLVGPMRTFPPPDWALTDEQTEPGG